MSRIIAIVAGIVLGLAASTYAKASWETSIGVGGQFGGDVLYDPPDVEREADGS